MTLLILWASGYLACLFLFWRERRFLVQLPYHEADEWPCVLATMYARLSLAVLWPVLLFIEALIHRRKESM